MRMQAVLLWLATRWLSFTKSAEHPIRCSAHRYGIAMQRLKNEFLQLSGGDGLHADDRVKRQIGFDCRPVTGPEAIVRISCRNAVAADAATSLSLICQPG